MENLNNEKRNLSMLMDFYELTMSNGFLDHNNQNTKVCFDVFFRKCPENGGYAIAAGLEQLVDYVKNLKFTESDIEYLRLKNLFNEEFLNYLLNFKFTGDIYAVPEGTVVFPMEPIVTVVAPVIEAQLLETMLLLTINHQSLIATKTSRIVRAANGRPVMEFGARRAHGYDAAEIGARAAYIAGASGTATASTDIKFGVPALGTMAHSFIQFYGNEYEAFKSYAETYPDSCILLVDTYDVLRSGIPNAIKVAHEILEPNGHRLKGIRLDSGDLTYLSKKVRKMLDEEGLTDCKITVSNSLDEYTIKDLLDQGAQIDSFGVGERMITAKSEPVFGGVYKLAAVEDNEGNMIPRIKISENVEKITNPGMKVTYRFISNDTGKALGDVICKADEIINSEEYELFDPVYIWKKTTIDNYTVIPLQVPIFKNGELVYNLPNIQEIRKNCEDNLNTLWDEIKRFNNPHKYYVDLSKDLWFLKNEMLQKAKHYER